MRPRQKDIRQKAIKNKDKTYIAFCKRCDKETVHETSNSKGRHSGACKPCRALWRKNNKKLIDEGMKRYYQENREERLLYGKQYRKNNPDKIRERARKWEATPAAKKWRTEYKMKRYHSEPVYRLKEIRKRHLHHFLKQVGGTKTGRTEELLGYTAEELKVHLESLFKDGMTWENQGKWHIDHRIPQSYFTSIDQIKECFALSNLKPEWAEWNMSKGNRFIG